MARTIGFIFARGGSKGVPGKNLRLLGGKPLIGRAIEAALGSRSLDRVIVSTDCPHIAETARNYGGEVPFLRPAELATDTAPERLAWRHAIEQIEALDGKRLDVLVSVPPTCPLRLPEDIDRAVDALQDGGDIVLTACDAACNPYFNMITIGDHGEAALAATPPQRVTRRQDAPEICELTAVAYAARRDPIFKYDSIFASDARAVRVPRERAVDIDTEFDLQLAEFLYEQTHQNQQKAA